MSEVEVYKSKRNYDYKGTEVSVIKSQYYNEESAALVLVVADNMDSTVLTASVNVGEDTGLWSTYIKDYSENSGVKQWLIDNALIEAAELSSYQTGYVTMTKHDIVSDAFAIMADTDF